MLGFILTTHLTFLIYLEKVKSSCFLAALSSTKSTVVRLSVCLLVGRLALGVCEKSDLYKRSRITDSDSINSSKENKTRKWFKTS